MAIGVTIEIGGRAYSGTYKVSEGWVAVSCRCAVKRAALHLSTPSGLARLLLGEIAVADQRRQVAAA